MSTNSHHINSTYKVTLEKGWIYEPLAFIIISSLVFRLENFAIIDILYSLLSIGIVFGILLFKWKKLRCVWPFVLTEVLFYCYVTYNTVINEGDINIYGQFSLCLRSIALIILLIECMKSNCFKPFEIVAKVFFIIIVMNFIQLLFFPTIMGTFEGRQLYLISGNYNQFGGPILVGSLSAFLLTKKKGSGLYHSMLLISLLTVLYCGSVTTSVGILLLLIYSVFGRHFKFLSKLAVIVMLFVLVFVFLDFVLSDINFFGETSFLENFLNYTGKDPTFSGRTAVWARSILLFLSEPLTGVGLYTGDIARTFLLAYNSHNLILDLLLIGGAVLLLSVILLVVILIGQMHKYLDSYYYYGMIFTFEVYLLMMQFEVYSYYMIFMFLFIMYYSVRIPDFRKKTTNCYV